MKTAYLRGASPAAMAACNGWGTGFVEGTAHPVTWSSPFPVYNAMSGDVWQMYWTDDAGNALCANTSSLTATPLSQPL